MSTTHLRSYRLDGTQGYHQMLRDIAGPLTHAQALRLSAHDWRYTSTDSITDDLVGRVMDADGLFSEERECMLRTTLRELIANSQRALTEQGRGEHYSRHRRIGLSVVLGSNGMVLNVRDEGQGFDARNLLRSRRCLVGLWAQNGWTMDHRPVSEGLKGGGTGLYTLAIGLEQFGYRVLHNTAGNEVAVCIPFDDEE